MSQHSHHSARPGALSRRQVLASAAGLAASGLLPATATAQATRGGTLRVCVNYNPSSLDPTTGFSGTDHSYLTSLYDTLVNYTPDTLEARPGLARAWRWADPTTLVLTLEPDVLFHDGSPCDAQAVKANFDRMLTGQRSTVKGDLSSVKSAAATGPLEVTLTLSQPDSALVLTLSDRAGMMVSPKAFTAGGGAIDRQPVGTGPMSFVRWADNDEVVVQRFPQYWRKGFPLLDGVVFKVMLDTNTGLRSVLAGQNDFIFRVPPQQIPQIKRAPGVVLEMAPTLYVQQFYVNFSRPPLNDIRVRQAINFAIDRETYTKVATAGTGEVGNLHLPKRHWAYDAQAAARYPFDPDKARSLLKEAGLATGLKINANHYSDQVSLQRMEIIASFLGKVGITLDHTAGSVAQTNQQWNDGVGDIRFASWTGRPDPSITYALLFLPTSFYNRGGAEPSPELTKAINASRATDDMAARKAALATVLRLEREFALSIPLAFEAEVVAHQAKVKDYMPNLIGRPRFDAVHLG